MMNTRFITGSLAGIIAAALAGGAIAQMPSHQTPAELEGVGVNEKLGDYLPLDLTFTDETGKAVTLRSLFEPGQPVILTPNYYTCPMLCHLTLNGLVDGMRGLEWTAGQQFKVITYSINPNETPPQALAFGNAYLHRYGREKTEEAGGWRFLVGNEKNIAKLSEAIGFGFRFDPRSGDYAHPSTIVFITPEGRISRYMNDIMFEPRDLRLALVEASEGAIGTRMDRILLFTCFQWDPDRGSYVPVAWKLMRTGGLLTVVVLAFGLFVLWLRGSRFEQQVHKSASPQVQTETNVREAASGNTP